MKMKRLICAALAGALLLTAVGCQQTGGQDGSSGSAADLEWYFPGDTQPDQDEVWAQFNEKVKEKIGVGVHINMIDRGSYNDKMTMMLASGTPFDICFASNWTNNFIQSASKGAYMALDELLQSTPKLRDSMPEYVWNGAKYDNKIYGVPSYQIMFIQNSVVLPKELKEKYNYDFGNPQTEADFEEFIKIIQENEPSLYPTQPLSRTSIYETISPTEMCIERDTTDFKVYATVETQEYKDFLQLRREWNQKGYFRPDIMTVTDDRNDRMALKYGLIASTYKPGSEGEMKTLYKADMLNIPYGDAYVSASAGQGAIMSLSRTCKQGENALKFIELLATDVELYNMFIYGIEGKHYTKDENNIVTVAQDSGYTMASQWMFGNQFNAYYQVGQEVGAWEKTDELNRQAKVSPLSGFVLNVEPIKTEIAQYDAVKKEYAHIEYGTEEVEGLYQEYLDKLKKAGLDKIREEVQNQVTQWAKDNGKLG